MRSTNTRIYTVDLIQIIFTNNLKVYDYAILPAFVLFEQFLF